MSRWGIRRERFRAALEGTACVSPASVHDPISARIAESLGFELGMFAGSVASLTVLGAPDLILLTLSELAEQAYRISRAAELPLLVDADHGYGNALNVMRTVEELENAGVAGLSIEDTDLPQPFGRGGAPSLISIEEGAAKMSAALEARSDPSLVIAGRTSAAAFAGIDEAIARAKAYESVGCDAIFLVGVKTVADLEAVASELSRPLIIGGQGPEVTSAENLAEFGVRVCLQGHQPLAAALQAVYQTMKALRDGVPPKDLPNLASADMIKTLSRNGAYEDWVKRFLGG